MHTQPPPGQELTLETLKTARVTTGRHVGTKSRACAQTPIHTPTRQGLRPAGPWHTYGTFDDLPNATSALKRPHPRHARWRMDKRRETRAFLRNGPRGQRLACVRRGRHEYTRDHSLSHHACQRVTSFKSVKAVTANEGRSKRLGSPRQRLKTDAEAEFRAPSPGGVWVHVGAWAFSQGRAWGFRPWFEARSEGGG